MGATVRVVQTPDARARGLIGTAASATTLELIDVRATRCAAIGCTSIGITVAAGMARLCIHHPSLTHGSGGLSRDPRLCG